MSAPPQPSRSGRPSATTRAAAPAARATAAPSSRPAQTTTATAARGAVPDVDYGVSTPRGLSIFRVLAVLTCLVSGLVGMAVLGQTANNLQAVSERTEQLLLLQGIKADILRGDGLATNGLAQGSKEPASQQTEYRAALQQAAKDTVTASTAVPGDAVDLAEVNAALVTYVASLETSRTSVRNGEKVAASTLDDASLALRSSALPKLDARIAANQAVIDAKTQAVNRAWAILIAAVPVIVLLLASLFAARRTRRVLNIGLLAALIAAIAIWRFIDGGLSQAGAEVNTTKTGSLQSARAASAALVAVSDAKAHEGAMAVNPSAYTTYESAYAAAMARAKDEVAKLPAADRQGVSDKLAAYQSAHDAFVAAVRAGRAADIAASAGHASSTGVNATYREAGAALGMIATTQKQDTQSSMATTRRSLQVNAGLSLVLGILGALGAFLGLGRRIKEFR